MCCRGLFWQEEVAPALLKPVATPARASVDCMDTILTCYDSEEEMDMIAASQPRPVVPCSPLTEGEARTELAQTGDVLPGTAVILTAEGPMEVKDPELEPHKTDEDCNAEYRTEQDSFRPAPCCIAVGDGHGDGC